MKILSYAILFSILLLNSCKKDDDTATGDPALDQKLESILSSVSDGQGKDYFILPLSTDFEKIPQDPNNLLTLEKVVLGQMLYHETGIALNPMQEFSKGTYSCASCHFASAGFQAGRHQGISDGGIGFGINGEGRERSMAYTEEMLDVQPIRSPSSLNSAYQSLMLWNGQFGATDLNEGTEYAWEAGTPIETNNFGYEGVETQAIAGLKVHRMLIEEDFINTTNYKNLFDVAFPGVLESERYSRENAGLAVAAYERTLLANEAPFQKWLRGEVNAMSDDEKTGAILFFGEAQCATCHTGPALNIMAFEAVGMNDLYECDEETFKAGQNVKENLGRGGFTGKDEDMYKFKVPQLYNLSDSPFYGHGSSLRSIEEVVQYFNEAVAENHNVPDNKLSEHFVPLELTKNEVEKITLFIAVSLRDPNLARYEPANLPSGNCFPFADPLAKNELGCN